MQGLKNLGATCAVNSLIQIICRNKYLRNSILNEDIPDNTLAIELKEILKILFIDKNSISPNKFIHKLYNTFNHFYLGEQIDITELWFLLFDKISQEIDIPIKKLEYKKIYDNIDLDHNLINLKADTIINNINNSKSSKWLQNCQGVILNQIKCNSCNYISYNFEPFISIQLDLPDNFNDNSITLTSLFRNYLNPIINNSDDWKCDNCKKFCKYTKSFKLWKVPNVLIFLIKRYDINNNKNNKPIDINTHINIKKGCILNNKDLDVSYNINSIAMHIGDLNGGHYFSICKNDDNNKFVMYDDLNIKVFNKDNNHFLKNNSDAYMIIYSI